jgi:hypothetical protein
VIAALASAALAGPWVHDPGDWYVKGAVSGFQTPHQALEYGAHALSLYGEVGVVEHLQVIGSLPYVWGWQAFSGSTLRYRVEGPGAAMLGLGVSPPHAQVPASLHVLTRIPLYGGIARSRLDPALGDAQLDVDAIAAVGASPPVGSSARLWTSAELGARIRTGWVLAGEPADGSEGLLYRAQVGFLPGELGWLEVAGSGELGPRAAQQAGAGLAVSLGHGLHLEAGGTWIWQAAVDATGVGWTAGISHSRSR